MLPTRSKIGVWLILLLGFLPACKQNTDTVLLSQTPERQLIPYHTATATSTFLPAPAATMTPLPPASPTPVTHTVKAGEDMGGIAYRYGISIAALMAANPEVNPNLMSIGTVLIIPASSNPDTTENSPPGPTPVPVSLSAPQCYPSQEGGLWCFLRVENLTSMEVESVSAKVQITSESGETSHRTAITPLNVLKAGSWLPMLVYFPPPLPPLPYQANASLLTALAASDSSMRYPNVQIENFQYEIAQNGLSAFVSGEAVCDTDIAQANITAAALDQYGNLTGVRNWVSRSPLAAGQRMPFAFHVYGSGQKINRAVLFAEGHSPR
ncbi:MAG: LysM peptidoglycan-binding domain-containing protein [Anaerolineae bacterium]|nr:LysM peptidoglycan-binding domain-containing protein [Anaerolineae bacterium]